MTVDWSTCPPQNGAARDAWLLAAVEAGEAEYEYAEVPLEVGGRQGFVYIFRDALKLGGVRINVSADLEQQIADRLGCVLLTPQLADFLFAARQWTVTPKTSNPDNQMASTARMIAHSDAIDASLVSQGYNGQGIVQTNGKHWALIKTMPAGKACNYGWHFLGSGQAYAPATSYTGPGVRVWQPVSTTHNPQHSDYSQVCVLAARRMVIDGTEYDLGAVMMDAALSGLVAADGPLSSDRMPGVDSVPAIVPAIVTPGGGGDVPPAITDGPPPAPPAGEGESTGRKVGKLFLGLAALAALFLGARAASRG